MFRRTYSILGELVKKKHEVFDDAAMKVWYGILEVPYPNLGITIGHYTLPQRVQLNYGTEADR